MSQVCYPLCLKHDCPRPCPICDKKKGVRKMNNQDYEYAKHFFELNPIRESELRYYAGQVRGKKPHGIDNKVWRKAFNWAKRNKQLNIGV